MPFSKIALTFSFVFILVNGIFSINSLNPQRSPSSKKPCSEKVFEIIKKKMAIKSKYSINHPTLNLWDNWAVKDGKQINVYSLAASKKIGKQQRHFHAHWRHFYSNNYGKTWIDKGPIITNEDELIPTQSIWSGSIIPLNNKQYLAAYTRLEKRNKNKFFQSISLATSDDGHHFKKINPKVPLLSHEYKRKEWKKLNYYIELVDKIGRKLEKDRTIQALRDPFLFLDKKNKIHLFWAARE